MSIPRFFSRQTVLVNMLMIAILVAGLVAIERMALEDMPNVDMDSVLIIVPYPGAAPDDVEKLITLPIEDQIKSLPDIDFIHASSEEGRSFFFIQYEVGLDDFDQAVMDLKDEVDKVKPDLPEEAREDLFYIKIATNEVWPVMSITMGGEYSVEGLNQIAEAMRDDLLDLMDVAKVDIFGIRNREIWVEIDRARLQAAGLSLLDINTAIQAANINLPAGAVEMGREEFLMRAMGEVVKPEEIGDIVLRASGDGGTLRVRDVAKINDTWQERDVVTRLDGNSSVHVRVYMTSDGNVVDVSQQVRALVKRYNDSVPDLVASVRNDRSKDVTDSLSALTSNIFTGLFLVVLLMTLSIGLRSAVLAVIGIPFAFLTSFIFLDATGNTINTLSLFAFILVLGMVVDDAIIIIENVYRHMEEGKSPWQAAVEGTEQVMWPVVAAILTTVSAFLPLLMMEGVMGKFLAVMPIVVTLALLGSLVQSLVVLPSHLADFGKLPKNQGKRMGDRFFERLQRVYKWQVNAFLNWKYVITFLTIVATVVSIFMAYKVLRIEMFPEELATTERLLVRLPTGTKLEETDRILKMIEERIEILPKEDVASYSTIAGLIIENKQWNHSTSGGMIVLEMGEDKEARRSNNEIKTIVRQSISDIPEIENAYFSAGGDGPPTGDPVELRVLGDDLTRMQQLADQIAEDLRAKKGVLDVQVHYTPGKKELRFVPDRVKMSTYGLSMTQLAMTLRTAVEGFEATTFRDDDGDEVKVLVMYREDDRDAVDDMASLVVSTPLGINVPLSELGEFVIQRGNSRIVRRDGKRAITVTADVNKIDINSEEANRFIREKYSDFSQRYPGFRLDFGGEAEEMQKSFKSLLQAYLVALILIYLILGTQFQSFTQPLVVMFTVPFSILGVAVGLIVMNLTFSLVAGISVVALSGVVVNDSLVLVDFVNKARAAGMKRRMALVVSGARRMRPILLTTVTTIAGLLPMALGIGGTSITWKPMAICIIWGLAFATFLTLFIIPCVYSIMDDWVNFLRRVAGMRSTDEVLVARAAELKDETVLSDLDPSELNGDE